MARATPPPIHCRFRERFLATGAFSTEAFSTEAFSTSGNLPRTPSSVLAVDLSARIVTLQLAETFTIARESQDTAEVVQVELRHDGASGFGEAAPIGRYEESAQSALAYVEEASSLLGDDPWALDEI